MKRFLLFSGADYYPSGGWDDFKDSFDTIELAKDYLLAKKGWEIDDWWQIVDSTIGKIVLTDSDLKNAS